LVFLLVSPSAAQLVVGEVMLAESAARTATGTGSAIVALYKAGPNARCYLDVTAVTGTSPNLVVDIQGMVNGQSYVLGSFAAKTAVSKETITITAPAETLRAAWTISGTAPSFTFSVVCSRPG
jgi:hypothetical protein